MSLTLHRADEAAGAYEEALALRREVAAADPDNFLAKATVGRSLYRLARAYDEEGRIDPAIEACTQAANILAAAHGRDPANRDILAEAGLASLRLGFLHRERAVNGKAKSGAADWTSAQTAFEKASSLFNEFGAASKLPDDDQERIRQMGEARKECRRKASAAVVRPKTSPKPAARRVTLLYSSLVRGTTKIAILAPALLAAAYGQTSGKAEFEAASIKVNPPQPGFHFAADAVSGGPGTADPGLFRCSRCSLATLIVKAFNLQPYQFPGRTSVTDNTYEVLAKIPTGATPEEFSAMLQNLLKDRFGLTWHFQEKKMKGYHLVIAKDGSKLKESTGASPRRRSAPLRTSRISQPQRSRRLWNLGHLPRRQSNHRRSRPRPLRSNRSPRRR